MGETSMLEGNPVIDIFELRRQSAELNLEALEAFVEAIRVRTSTLRVLRDKLSLDDSEVRRALNDLRAQLEFLREGFKPPGRNREAMESATTFAMKHLTELKEAIDAARGDWRKISGLKLDPEMIKKGGDQGFQRQVRQHKQALDDLRGNAKRRWKELRSELWTEYLDYLAGVSLRHDGLDKDICGIADHLIRELKQSVNDLQALAILGRDCCIASLPEIVYLRFPEWTVWVLPLAAGELWRDAKHRNVTIAESYLRTRARDDLDKVELMQPVSNGTEMQSVKRKDEKKTTLYSRWIKEQLLEDCLTDIFGTYALGRAYVLSSIFLSFDPSEDDDRIRAEIILDVMRSMNNQDLIAPKEANASVDAIESAWKQAVNEAAPENSRSPERVKMREDLKKWKDSFLNYLSSWKALRFPIARWEPEKKELVGYFLPPNSTEAKVQAPETVRMALAAAWEARIQNLSKSTSIAIAAKCEELCERIALGSGPDKPTDEPEPPPINA
jgi:hypothetical protein